MRCRKCSSVKSTVSRVMDRKNLNRHVVLTRISPGISAAMRRIARNTPIRVVLLVAAWRGLTELLVRRRQLQATGELGRRLELRRMLRIEHALVRAGLRAPARALVRVPVVGDATAQPRIHASVHVGSIAGPDLDDVGLLEAAMRRAADRRTLVTPIDDRPDAHRTDWGGMLEDANPIERAWRVVEALGAVPLLAMVVGVSMTFYPLVRPLDDVAPWLALGGLALVVAGVLGARWTDRRSADDDDDEPSLHGA